MSYDCYLQDPITEETLHFDEAHQMVGGTYAAGGTTEAWLNVTFNYRPFYCANGLEDSLKTLRGMTAADSIPLLQGVADKLGDDVDDDYWKPTEGNAKRALLQLIAMAKLRPDGVWTIHS